MRFPKGASQEYMRGYLDGARAALDEVRNGDKPRRKYKRRKAAPKKGE
jgi:hypothetical protein